MDCDEHDEEIKELLEQFEEALREHLKTSEEFQNLISYLAKKHGSISLYVAAQVMGDKVGARKTRRQAFRRPVPVRFEMTRGDLKFLRSLKIKTDI